MKPARVAHCCQCTDEIINSKHIMFATNEDSQGVRYYPFCVSCGHSILDKMIIDGGSYALRKTVEEN